MNKKEREYVLWCLCEETYPNFKCVYPNRCVCPTKEYVNFLIGVFENILEKNNFGNSDALINWRCTESECPKKKNTNQGFQKTCTCNCADCCIKRKKCNGTKKCVKQRVRFVHQEKLSYKLEYKINNPDTIYYEDKCKCFNKIIELLSFVEKNCGSNDEMKRSIITLLLFFFKKHRIGTINNINENRIIKLLNVFYEAHRNQNADELQALSEALNTQYIYMLNLKDYQKKKKHNKEYFIFLEVFKKIICEISDKEFFAHTIMYYYSNVS